MGSREARIDATTRFAGSVCGGHRFVGTGNTDAAGRAGTDHRCQASFGKGGGGVTGEGFAKWGGGWGGGGGTVSNGLNGVGGGRGGESGGAGGKVWMGVNGGGRGGGGGLAGGTRSDGG